MYLDSMLNKQELVNRLKDFRLIVYNIATISSKPQRTYLYKAIQTKKH